MSRQALLTQVHVTLADEAQQRFIELQQKLLDYYGVRAKSRYVHLNEPRLRAHVLEAGQGEPVVIFHGGDGERISQSQFVPLPGIGHFPFLECPDKCTELIFDFLAE